MNPRTPKRSQGPSSASRRLSALMSLMLLMLIGGLSTSASAQGNPLDPPARPALKLPAFFEGDGLILSMERFDPTTGRLEGRLMLGEAVFAYTGTRANDGTVRGRFTVNAEQYDFTATEDAEKRLVFRTGNAAYTMSPVERPSRTFPAQQQPDTPPAREAPPATRAGTLIGTWTGTGKDETDDGTPLAFPITIVITESPDGALAADFRSTIDYPLGPGETLTVLVTGRFTGRGGDEPLTLRAPDITASANGQTQSLGAQILRLHPGPAGRMTGTVGNELHGWTPFELQRQGAAPDRQGETGTRPEQTRTPGETPGAGAGAGPGAGPGSGVAPTGQVIFEKVSLHDPGMDNMVSHTLLKPKGWQVRGGQQWNPQAYLDFVRMNLRVSADDGRELAVYPGGFYEDSNVYEVAQQMGAQSPRPEPGRVMTNGITYRPLPRDASAYVTEVVLPANRPQAREVRVVSVTDLPELAQQLRELMAPIVENAERNNQQLRQMGANVDSSMSIVAERVRITYQEDGRAFEEDVWVLGTVMRSSQQLQGMPVIHQVHWNMLDPRGVRAPAGRLEQERPLLEAVSLSIQPDPRYAAVIMDLQMKISKQQTDAIIKRGEIARQGREEAWQIYQSGVRERQASNDRMHDKFINYIRDVDRFQDIDGSTVKLPSLYRNVYSNGKGEYILTNEPFNPNDHATERWERINPRQ